MFTDSTFDFLAQLEQNNNKAWFNEHKLQYEQHVRTPALNLIEQASQPLSELSSHFVAAPKKIGGSLMRVYRDVRFGKDKTPYKTNIGIQFRHFAGKDVHAPGFYLHIAKDDCFIGAGIWHPESKALKSIRIFIDENPNGWRKAKAQFEQANFALVGDSLKTKPKGFDIDHKLIEDLKRKDFIVLQPLSQAQVVSPDLLNHCFAQYQHTSQLMKYLCAALDVPY